MASIGSGSTSSDGTITIAGSTVIGLSHHGDEYGIGLTEGGAVDTTINTDSIVFASGANGVESNGATGILLGTDVTIDDDAQTISLGADLTVPTGATLTVPPGWTLTINGHTLTNAGAIENHGTIAGTVTGTPAITVIPTASITMASTTVPWTGDGHPLTASVDPGEANTYEFAYTYEGVGDTDYSTSSTPPTDLGTYLVRATLTAPAGFSGSRKARLTIAPWTQAPLTLTGVPEVIRYGDSFTIGTLGGSGSGAVTYSVTETVTEPDPESGTEPERGPVVATIDPATGDVDVVEVGAFEVVATKAGSGAYAEATASAALIAVKALAPAIELPTYANPISYGAPLAASILDVPAGPTYGWFDWTDPWVMPTVAQSGEEFSIAFTPFDETTAHYEPVSDLTASMPVTVLPCDVIVTATGQNKAYDGTTAADVVLTPVGLVGDDVVTATGTGTFADPDVGEGKTVTVTDIVLGGKDGGNYQALAGMRPITANITPRPVTVVWSGTDLTYTGSPLAPSAEFTDVLDAVVPLTVTGQQTNVAASAYTATAVPPASGNYTLVNPTVEFTITEASTSPTTPPTTPSAPPTDPSTPPTTPPTTPSAPPADPSTPPTTPPTTPSTPPTTPPTDPPVAHPAAVSRFGVSFTSVVVRVGATVNVPVEVYRAAGTEPGHAQVTWTSSSPGTASVTTGKKSGTLSWNVGQAESLKVRAHRTGRATIRVTAPGARPLTVVVKAVPKARSVGVERLAIAAKRFASADDSNGFADALKSASAPIRVAAGKSVELKTWVYPLGALRSAGEWRSSKPAVAIVDAVGRVTAIAKGTTTITCEVGGTKARKTVIVT
ncbi:MAG: YDG domain-containing protein [Bifidobacteriaceae bacterium]|nr:YDG domain-containing protein [Bifidobacteriaceae bacterium]